MSKQTTINFHEEDASGAQAVQDFGVQNAAVAASEKINSVRSRFTNIKAKVKEVMLRKNEAYSRLAGFSVNNQTVLVIGFIVPLLLVASIGLVTTAPVQALGSAAICGVVVYRFNRPDFKKGDEEK